MAKPAVLLVLYATLACGAERQVDPTWLHRYLPSIAEQKMDVTTSTCHYKPIFGAGDPDARQLRGIARYAEIAVDSGGACEPVSRSGEEQAWFVSEGSGTLEYAETKKTVRKGDFFYVPAGVRHALRGGPVRAVAMGFRIPARQQAPAPPALQIANIDEVKKQVVGNHPPSTLYQLMMGDTKSTRDRLASARILTSLFIMEFAPGGTNFPHHHDREEEIYLVLDGEGDMVAGGGMDGVEGRHAAKAGDAYFFRLNCTVGFYNSEKPGTPKAHILAVRSLFPFRD